MELRLGRQLFVRPQAGWDHWGRPTPTLPQDPRAPQARPAPPRTPSPQLQPRRAAPPRSSRLPPAASPPKPRGARTWPRVPTASGKAAGERDYDAGNPPLPSAASLRPAGLPAPPPGSPHFLAPRSPRARELARSRSCRFAPSAGERGTHLPAEFFRSLPSSPELLTPAFRVKKGLGRATRKMTQGRVVARGLPECGK